MTDDEAIDLALRRQWEGSLDACAILKRNIEVETHPLARFKIQQAFDREVQIGNLYHAVLQRRGKLLDPGGDVGPAA